MKTGSDHEVIQFELTANESEWVESPLNASYNIVKADWPKFAETLQIFSSQIGNQIKNYRKHLQTQIWKKWPFYSEV
jgi:hypothetical protein